MILLFVIGIVLLIIGIAVCLKSSVNLGSAIISISFIILLITTLLSFIVEYAVLEVTPRDINIVEGKDAIYVETNVGNFTLKNLSSRSILKGKNVKVIIPKNLWGIELELDKRLKWDN